MGCNSFYFYIKPQPSELKYYQFFRCNSFYFYIKPQLAVCSQEQTASCNSFYFYIKPQPWLYYSLTHRWLCAKKSDKTVVVHTKEVVIDEFFAIY